MFNSSTQLKNWTFEHEEELIKLRNNANTKYRTSYCDVNNHVMPDADTFFLTVNEHCLLVQHYERKLQEICWKFKPPMPLNVVGTSCMYLKRLNLRKSVMDYHPRLMHLACIWLACKTEEFNISMDQFVQQVAHGNEETGDAILTIELILIQELNFHLTIHNPFRPLEGFLIDLKTRYRNLENAEQLRKPAKDFLVRSLNTDVGLLYAPSQLALAALLSAASMRNLNIDRYVTSVLLVGQPQTVLEQTIQRIKKIRTIVKNAVSAPLPSDQIEMLEQKLNHCYNKEKDPTSYEYSCLQQEIESQKYDKQTKKRKLEHERRRKIETELLGF